jgi:integrase
LVYLTVVKLAFDMAIKHEVISINPVVYADKPRIQRRERKAYTVTQMFRILTESEGNLKTFYHFAFFTGMRAGEILALTWEDVDMKKRVINVTKSRDDEFGVNKTKNRKDRQVPILDRLYEYLSAIAISDGFIVNQNYRTILRSSRLFCEKLGVFP